MMNFDEWKLFKLKDVFEIFKYGDVENVRALEKGKTKYVSTTRYNNGISKLVSNTDYKLEPGNCITVGIDGSFAAFYQKDEFIRTTNIAVLRNSQLNLYNGLFLITIIRCAISKYYYGVKLKAKGVLENTEILLPHLDNIPNWDFMTSYSKKLFNATKMKYVTSIQNNFEKIDFSNWREVKLTEIFDFERGQRYTKETQKKGKYPYISSSEENNGVDGYVMRSSKSKIYSDTITLTNSGSRGIVFYHEGEFIASDHVTVLFFKNGFKMTKEVGLFLKPIIEKNASRYLFNKEINKTTIQEIDLFLPFDGNDVDIKYICTFMKSLPNSDLIF